MAEESSANNTQGTGGAWWGSVSGFVSAAKNKSAEVLEFVKRDLDELSTTVKNEATNVVSTTTSALKESFSFDDPESTANNMKRSVSTFLGTVSNVLNPVPEDDDEAIIMKNDVPLALTRFQSRLRTLIAEDDTFTCSPEGQEATQFTAWLDIQDDILNNSKLSNLMVMFPELRAKYSELVPSKVCHAGFWKHFLFRKALLEDEEARWEAAEARKDAENRLGEEEPKSKVEDGKEISEDAPPLELQFSDAFKEKFCQLISDDKPFTVLLQGEEEVRFKAWLDIQEEDPSRSSKNKALVAAFPELQEIRARLVPHVMSNTDFWRRTWFRKALLEDELASIEAKKESRNRKKVEKTQPTEDEKTADQNTHEVTSSDQGEEDLSDERHRLETLRVDEYEDYLLSQVDDITVAMDIPEEEQMRLLQEYERECKIRRPSNGQKPSEHSRRTDDKPLPLEENHYSETVGEKGDPISEGFEPQSVTSLLDTARDRIFSLVKTAMDSLELADTDEIRDIQVKKTEEEGDAGSGIDRLVVKEKADMVIIGASSPPTSDSCSNDKESNYDDWERLESDHMDTDDDNAILAANGSIHFP